MRTRMGIVVAATLLSVAAGRAMAGELEFRAPDTDRARQVQTVLTRAAEALNTEVPRAVEEQISNLWLFPTADEDTVFAQYVVSKGQGAGSQKHLELVKVSGDRIVEWVDLTRAGDEGASHSRQAGVGLDRTALIGTGHAATDAGNAESSATTHGSPASPHWSASIGTGHVSGESDQRSEVLARESKLEAPVLHWTSKIGTGHAADSSASRADGGVRLTAGE